MWHVYPVDYLATAFALAEYYFSIHKLCDITLMSIMLTVGTDLLIFTQHAGYRTEASLTFLFWLKGLSYDQQVSVVFAGVAESAKEARNWKRGT